MKWYELLGWYDAYKYNRKKRKYGVWNISEILLDITALGLLLGLAYNIVLVVILIGG